MILSPGAMAALHLALRASARPDGEVIIPIPCWIDYPLYVRAAGLTPVPVPLTGPSFDLDVDALSSAINGSTCAVLLAHPANPTGRLYDPETLRNLGWAVSRMADRFGRRSRSSPMRHIGTSPDGGSFRSIAEVCGPCLIVYSFGKYHFIQGQRIGYALFPRGILPGESFAGDREVDEDPGSRDSDRPHAAGRAHLLGLRYDMSWLGAWRDALRASCSARQAMRCCDPNATPVHVRRERRRGKEDFAFVRELASAWAS